MPLPEYAQDARQPLPGGGVPQRAQDAASGKRRIAVRERLDVGFACVITAVK
jgi:hypothetical protein